MTLSLSPRFLYSGCCPPNWVASETSCYYVDNTRTRRMSDAREKCRQMEGDIAMIRSAYENQFIFNLVEKTRGIPEHWGVWIGLQRKADGSFQWVDESPLGYSKWYPGEPNDTGGREDCGHMGTSGGGWNDSPCDWEVEPAFVCQMPKRDWTHQFNANH